MPVLPLHPSSFRQLSRRAAMFSLLVLALLGAGCTTEPVEPEQQPEKAIVLPLSTLHKEMRNDSSIVQRQLVSSLRKAGYDCVEIDADEFEQMQRKAFDESGSIYNPSIGEYIALDDRLYRANLLQQLRARKFDVMILPELQLRGAQVQGNNILWDGVTRPIQVRGTGKYLAPREARGLSIMVTAYGSTGVLVGKGVGGITVPFYLDTTTSDTKFRMRDAFYDAEEVNEGVTIAIRGLRRN